MRQRDTKLWLTRPMQHQAPYMKIFSTEAVARKNRNLTHWRGKRNVGTNCGSNVKLYQLADFNIETDPQERQWYQHW